MFSRLVNIMVSGAAFRTREGRRRIANAQTRSVGSTLCIGGQSAGASHSPVDVFVTYDGKRAADIAPPRYAVQHLVATEISPRGERLHSILPGE